ncbi:hypothetical protein JTY60_00555 [symbiont of Argiope bruennichi]|uniref:hypothetical protein n=1 Tax=symbiont of Argiope bruennichi TaxID=2810479 RepID=UPI003DA43E54
MNILSWSSKRKYTEYTKDQDPEREKKHQEFLQLIKDPTDINYYNKIIETDENKDFLDFLKENKYCFDYNFEDDSDKN